MYALLIKLAAMQLVVNITKIVTTKCTYCTKRKIILSSLMYLYMYLISVQMSKIIGNKMECSKLKGRLYAVKKLLLVSSFLHKMV